MTACCVSRSSLARSFCAASRSSNSCGPPCPSPRARVSRSKRLCQGARSARSTFRQWWVAIRTSQVSVVAELVPVTERLGEDILHGVFRLGAIAEQVLTSAVHGSSVLGVELSQRRPRIGRLPSVDDL